MTYEMTKEDLADIAKSFNNNRPPMMNDNYDIMIFQWRSSVHDIVKLFSVKYSDIFNQHDFLDECGYFD
jgi:hypothetical protein